MDELPSKSLLRGRPEYFRLRNDSPVDANGPLGYFRIRDVSDFGGSVGPLTTLKNLSQRFTDLFRTPGNNTRRAHSSQARAHVAHVDRYHREIASQRFLNNRRRTLRIAREEQAVSCIHPYGNCFRRNIAIEYVKPDRPANGSGHFDSGLRQIQTLELRIAAGVK
jgi:hypothetical protein